MSRANPLFPMRLYWSSRSPFVRKVMIAFHELGIAEHVETQATFVTGSVAVPELEPINPLGQIPTLILGDGTIIYDSDVILDFVDRHFGGGRLIPTEFPQRLDVLRRAALAKGIKEKSIRWLHERFRPTEKQEVKVLDGHARSIGIALDAVNADAERFGALPLDIGHCGLAAALAYLDFRFADFGWRNGRPQLAAWHAKFAERPSYVKTEFVHSNRRVMPAPANA